MSPITISAIVLTLTPYRETSALITLYTDQHGLSKAISKGLYRSKKGINVPQRGTIVQATLYRNRQDEGLDRLANLVTTFWHTTIRTSLIRTALQDIAFEMLIATLHQHEEQENLFNLICWLLNRLDTAPSEPAACCSLWRFLLNYLAIHGYLIATENCCECGSSLNEDTTATLNPSGGGLSCRRCRSHSESSIPLWIFRMKTMTTDDVQRHAASLQDFEPKRITLQILHYLQYHFGIQLKLQPVAFL